MTLVSTPARTAGDLGAALTDVRAPAVNELSAVHVEKIKDHLIEIAAALNGNVTQNNLSAGAAPTVNDDSGDGYAVGSAWYYPGNGLWFCADATLGAAVWVSWIVSSYGSSPAEVGTTAASAGSSSQFAKGDHVHASPRLARQFVGTEISSGTPLATTTGVYIADLTGAAFNLELPDPTTMIGYRWLIVDKYGAAGTHALTLLRNDVGDKINGATSNLILDVDGFAVELFCESPGEWICRKPVAGVDAAYVDAGDAATLASAEAYADAGDLTLSGAISAKPDLGTGIVSVGSANANGSAATAAKVDHVHAHGSQTDDTMHAVATKDAGGFVDKDSWDSLLGQAKKWILFFRETWGMGSLALWGASVNGTGAAASATTTGGMPAQRVYCGTTATGYANLKPSFNNITASIYSQYFVETLNALEVRPSVAYPNDEYVAVVCFVGLISAGAPSGDCFGFRSIGTSGNWQATKWISGTPTDIDTGVATSLSLTRFRVEHVPGTSITWYINGTQVAQITSSMPTISAAYIVPQMVYGVSYTSLATRAIRCAFAYAAGKLASERV